MVTVGAQPYHSRWKRVRPSTRVVARPSPSRGAGALILDAPGEPTGDHTVGQRPHQERGGPPTGVAAHIPQQIRRLPAVELPGHGRRYRQQAITRAELAVRDIIDQLGEPVDVIYGESLGAYIG